MVNSILCDTVGLSRRYMGIYKNDSYCASLELSNGSTARIHQPVVSYHDITRGNRRAFTESASVAFDSLPAFLTRGTYGLGFKSWRIVFPNSECSPALRRRRRNVRLGVRARHAKAF